MNNLTHDEKVDMFEVYILCHKNARDAVNMYRERYPDREVPRRRFFRKLETRLRANTQAFNCKRVRVGNNIEIDILAYFEANPTASIRMVAAECNVGVATVHRYLKKHKYKPYKYHKIHHLHPGDHERRLEFCHLLQNEGHEILKKIIWTDEANFSNNGMFNRHNTHYWSRVNPVITRDTGFQEKFSVNVWCAILNNRVYCYMYEGTLTGARYLEFLRDMVDNILDDLPLLVLRDVYFQQDGAPAHNSRQVAEYLNNYFPNQWIGTNGPIAWPARSPDLSPLDFFLWGYLKNKVYATVHPDVENLRNNIEDVITNIDRRTLRKVRHSLFKRVQLCINQNGGNFEQFL